MEYKSMKEEKFDSIYRANVDLILQVAMHYLDDYDMAQEITQEAFFRLYRHFENINKLESVQSWLISSVRYQVFNLNRDSKREILSETVGIIMEQKSTVDYSDSMDKRYIREGQKKLAQELSDSIFAKLYKKNKKWYEAITLVYCLEKPQQEVAEELGITIEVLNGRLYRARQWIRKNYEKEYEKVVNWL